MSIEPVGTKLHDLLIELGIPRQQCEACIQWMHKMDQWGISGCRNHRSEILLRLAEASDTVGWIDMAKVVTKGYFSIGALLDEAIKRAAT